MHLGAYSHLKYSSGPPPPLAEMILIELQSYLLRNGKAAPEKYTVGFLYFLVFLECTSD